MAHYELPKGRPSEKPNVPLLQYTQIFEKDDIKTTWTWDKTRSKNSPISVEIEYPRDYKNFEEEQASLPITKRQYFDEESGYYVGYQTAKKKGII
jgi:hypothetical protein